MDSEVAVRSPVHIDNLLGAALIGIVLSTAYVAVVPLFLKNPINAFGMGSTESTEAHACKYFYTTRSIAIGMVVFSEALYVFAFIAFSEPLNLLFSGSCGDVG